MPTNPLEIGQPFGVPRPPPPLLGETSLAGGGVPILGVNGKPVTSAFLPTQLGTTVPAGWYTLPNGGIYYYNPAAGSFAANLNAVISGAVPPPPANPPAFPSSLLRPSLIVNSPPGTVMYAPPEQAGPGLGLELKPNAAGVLEMRPISVLARPVEPVGGPRPVVGSLVGSGSYDYLNRPMPALTPEGRPIPLGPLGATRPAGFWRPVLGAAGQILFWIWISSEFGDAVGQAIGTKPAGPNIFFPSTWPWPEADSNIGTRPRPPRPPAAGPGLYLVLRPRPGQPRPYGPPPWGPTNPSDPGGPIWWGDSPPSYDEEWWIPGGQDLGPGKPSQIQWYQGVRPQYTNDSGSGSGAASQ